MNLNKKNIINYFIKSKVHLGYNLKNNAQTSSYMLGTRLNQPIINLNQTYIMLKKVCFFLAQIVPKNQSILFVGDDLFFLERYIFSKNIVGVFYMSEKTWRPGFFTNFNKYFPEYLRIFKRHFLKFKADHFYKIKTSPKIIIVLNPSKHERLIYEAFKAKKVIIAIVDSNCSSSLLSKITYAIPGNNVSMESQFCFVQFFLQAIKVGRQRRFKKAMFGLNMTDNILQRRKLRRRMLNNSLVLREFWTARFPQVMQRKHWYYRVFYSKYYEMTGQFDFSEPINEKEFLKEPTENNKFGKKHNKNWKKKKYYNNNKSKKFNKFNNKNNQNNNNKNNNKNSKNWNSNKKNINQKQNNKKPFYGKHQKTQQKNQNFKKNKK